MKTEEILKKVLQQITKETVEEQMKEEITVENHSFVQAVREVYRDELKKEISKALSKSRANERGLVETKLRLDEHEERFKKSENRLSKQEGITDIIQWDNIKVKELQDAVRARCHYHTGNKHNPKYILFYRSFSIQCNNHVKDIFGVNSTLKLKNDDFQSALKAVNNWRPLQKNIDRRIHTLINRQEKGLLDEVEDRALNLYMESLT